MEPRKKFLRSNDRIIAGVCGGIADYFDADAIIRSRYGSFIIHSWKSVRTRR